MAADASMLQAFFPYRLAVTAEAFSRQLVEVYGREFGLTREEWRLLFLLAQSGPVSSRELAALTSLDKVQVSRAADRLEAKGLILRATHATDRRLRLYSCTDAGRVTFDKAYRVVSARADKVLALMSREDRDALDRGLTGLNAVLQGLATPEG